MTQFWPRDHKRVADILQPRGEGQEDDKDIDLEPWSPWTNINLATSTFHLSDITKHWIVLSRFQKVIGCLQPQAPSLTHDTPMWMIYAAATNYNREKWFGIISTGFTEEASAWVSVINASVVPYSLQKNKILHYLEGKMSIKWKKKSHFKYIYEKMVRPMWKCVGKGELKKIQGFCHATLKWSS